MKIVDINILLYAIDRDSPHHSVVRRWWQQTLSSEQPVGLTWIVLLGFLRIATSHRIFPNALTSEQALERVDAWIAHPTTRMITENDDHWDVFRGLLSVTGTSGNLTTDAHLAALAISHGATLASCDTDFARYPRLRWENPLGAEER